MLRNISITETENVLITKRHWEIGTEGERSPKGRKSVELSGENKAF